MAEIVQTVCDKCGAEDAKKYRLSTPETGLLRAIALDLCDGCAKPVNELGQYGREVNVRTVTTPAMVVPSHQQHPIRMKVMSQEEIDAIEAEERSRNERKV